jgi:hypothetical protein
LETTSSGTTNAGRFPIRQASFHSSHQCIRSSTRSVPTQWNTKYKRPPKRCSRHMALNCVMNHMGYRVCPDEDLRIHVYAPMQSALSHVRQSVTFFGDLRERVRAFTYTPTCPHGWRSRLLILNDSRRCCAAQMQQQMTEIASDCPDAGRHARFFRLGVTTTTSLRLQRKRGTYVPAEESSQQTEPVEVVVLAVMHRI